jgi:hypothetical protein
VRPDEVGHESDARGILAHLESHAATYEKFFLTDECFVLADDDAFV